MGALFLPFKCRFFVHYIYKNTISVVATLVNSPKRDAELVTAPLSPSLPVWLSIPPEVLPRRLLAYVPSLQTVLKLETWRFLQCSWISAHSNSVFRPTTSGAHAWRHPFKSHLRCSMRILKTTQILPSSNVYM